jgi:hypothetical protein
MSAIPVREVMGMRPLFVILGPLLLLCAQGSSADEIPDDSVITLQHHTCERHCAVYKVVLFGDGTVIYYGQYYVRRKGLVLGSVDREVFRKLIDSAKRIDYFALKNEYGYHDMSGCDERLPDAPIVSTSITVGGQSHGIIHHQRCGSPITKQLTEFEIEIERLANIAQFIK